VGVVAVGDRARRPRDVLAERDFHRLGRLDDHGLCVLRHGFAPLR
jgi:hypothetical protein